SVYPLFTLTVFIGSVLSTASSTPDTPPSPYTTLFRSAIPSAGPTSDELALRNMPASAILADCVVTTCEPGCAAAAVISAMWAWRSEEHTSELQSHLNLVCRLLLEKKNQTHSHRLGSAH